MKLQHIMQLKIKVLDKYWKYIEKNNRDKISEEICFCVLPRMNLLEK